MFAAENAANPTPASKAELQMAAAYSKIDKAVKRHPNNGARKPTNKD